MRALLVVLLVAGPAAGEPRSDAPVHRDLCAAGVRHHGATIDLDVRGAELAEVFRFIADTAHRSVVVADDVTGKVTLRLARTPWDAAACAVAGVSHLALTLDGSVLLVMRASR